MKYIPILLLVILTGCATGPASNSDKWKKVENLSGEPLVTALVSYGDFELAEMKERRRNLRLEIATLETEVKTHPEKERDYSAKKAIDVSFTERLYEQALERKMALWKAAQKK